MKIEYLISIKKSDSFCADKESFVRFLCVDSKIKIENDQLNYNGYVFDYLLRENNDDNKEHIYFEFCLDFEDVIPEKDVISLNKRLKTNILKIDNKNTMIKILWDDFSTKYNTQAYPIINNLENLMRKLISKFMILNVGLDWFSKNTSEETQKKRRKKDGSDFFFDEVFQLDFIDLSEVLFKTYRSLKITELDNIIKDSDETAAIEISRIKDFYPISNWDRYFNSIVNKDANTISTLWSELYSIRNYVAHNRFIDRTDLDRLKEIQKELEPVLNKAIDSLDKISLSTNEKEDIKLSQNTTSHIRLIKLSKELNVGIQCLVDFLHKKGFNNVEANPNYKATKEESDILYEEFGKNNQKEFIDSESSFWLKVGDEANNKFVLMNLNDSDENKNQ